MTVDKFTALTPELHRYAVEHSSFRDPVSLEVEQAAEEMGGLALMQIAGDQAAFTTILVKAIAARRCVEVGTFLGYGAISIARGLPEDGELICCELKEEYAERARAHLDKAGLSDQVEIRVGPAIETLRAISEDGTFDLAFIDADKENYPDYYELVLARTRPGGLIAVDNVLAGGGVAGDGAEGFSGGSLAAIRRVNDTIVDDERVDCVMLAIADGVTLARKR